MGGQNKGPSFGEGLLEGLREAVAWKRGELALEVGSIDPMSLAPIRATRKRVARSAVNSNCARNRSGHRE